LTVSSLFYSLLHSLKIENISEFNSLFIDIGGKETSVGVVIGGGLVDSRSFPIGDWHFDLSISQALNVDLEEAKSLRDAYAKGQLLGEQVNQISAILSYVLRLWSLGLETALGSFSGVKSFPSQIYLVGGGAFSAEVREVLSDNLWTKNFPFSQDIEVKMVTLRDLRIKDLTGIVKDSSAVLPVSLGQVGKEVLSV